MTTLPEPPGTGAAAPGHLSPDEPKPCSAKGCRASAVWALVWNNPRVHTPERRKVWLACGDHREHLASFLSARSFLLDVVPVGELGPGGPA